MSYDWQDYEAEMSAFDARMRERIGDGQIGNIGGYVVVEAPNLLKYHEMRVFPKDRVAFTGELAHLQWRVDNALARQRLRDWYDAKVRQLAEWAGVDASLTTE